MTSALDTTLGVLEIGLVIGSILLGMNVLQVYFYFRNFPKDHWGLKLMVGSVCLFDIVHTSLLAATIYHYTVTYFGVLPELNRAIVTLDLSVFFTGLVTFIVQTFFAYRVYRITKNIPISIVCVFLSALRFAFSIGCAAEAVIIGIFSTFAIKWRWLVTGTIVVGAVNDVLIAATLVLTLNHNRSGMLKTDKIIDKLVAYTIGTGLITSMIAVSEVICFLTMTNYVWFAQLMVVAKMFSNSLLASLNARSQLREGLDQPFTSSGVTSSARRSDRAVKNSVIFATAPVRIYQTEEDVLNKTKSSEWE